MRCGFVLSHDKGVPHDKSGGYVVASIRKVLAEEGVPHDKSGGYVVASIRKVLAEE